MNFKILVLSILITKSKTAFTYLSKFHIIVYDQEIEYERFWIWF